MENKCRCTLCGKEGTMIYATIYIPGSVCSDCYSRARLIHDWAERAHKIIPYYESNDGYNHVQYLNAFGEIIWDKKYKYWKNAIKCLTRHTEKLMGPYYRKGE